MHVIVDIRTTSPQDTIPVRAGVAWAHLWRQYKKEDIVSFLMYEHQTPISGFDCIIVSKPLFPWSKKKLRQKNIKQIFRCVNFSGLPMYDSSIPTITHIWTNASHLYGDPTESSLMRRYHDFFRKIAFRRTTTLIVPDIQIGRELVELYDIGEDQIEIIPYLPLSEISSVSALQIIPTPHPFFIYDGGYNTEANIITLIAAWERYRRNGGLYELLLVGSAGEQLSTLTQAIRSLDLGGTARYLGFLDEGTLHTLYKKAEGWIYTGPYYSSGCTVELAQAYKLPMLLSDITAFSRYEGIKIHPNHITDIALGFKLLEKLPRQDIHTHAHHESAYVQAYEKVLVKSR